MSFTVKANDPFPSTVKQACIILLHIQGKFTVHIPVKNLDEEMLDYMRENDMDPQELSCMTFTVGVVDG